jgi:NAD(P)H-dependent FMN reductase
MTRKPRILALAGSTRKGSFNRNLLREAARGAVDGGAEVVEADLREFAMPLFDQDDEREHGMPEAAVRLKRLFLDCDGLLLASPEYNGSITGVLKNAIDWVSRRQGDEAPLAAFRGKAAALLAASPGALGGLRGLVHVRAILSNLGMLVLPGQLAVPKAGDVFADSGEMVDEAMAARARDVGRDLAQTLGRLLA